MRVNEFVLGFIYNSALKRIGLRIYNVDTQVVLSKVFPDNAESRCLFFWVNYYRNNLTTNSTNVQ